MLAQSHRDKGSRGWLWSLFHFLEALSLARMLHGVGAGRLHSHFANSGATVGLLAAHYLGIPWSLTLHGISEIDPPAGSLLPEKIRRAEFVACASWFMRAQGMRVVEPDQWHKMHIVRCGIAIPSVLHDAAFFKPIRHFVTVGRISAEKGYPGLVEALLKVRAQVPEVTLTVVGDGPLRPALEERLAATGLADCVTLLGGLPEEQTLARVSRADAFVLPSLMEGLPVVLMEAMACAKPVVAPMVAGIPELIRDGETGLLFRASDWDHLADQMLRLTRDSGTAARLGANGRDRVSQEFAIDTAVAPLPLLFRSGSQSRQLVG
jgi:glycosyltransferase involved in cell wall biosynthesis